LGTDAGGDLTLLILIDSNIFMYAAGTSHPHKEPSATFLEQVAIGEVDAVIDAEVLQENLHRYRAINRWQDGRWRLAPHEIRRLAGRSPEALAPRNR
jgi:predicted nucleic acid-binding protein